VTSRGRRPAADPRRQVTGKRRAGDRDPRTMPASELKVADKWDVAVETGIKRTAYGTMAAGVVAALLFRGAGVRAAITGLGAGAGLGATYADTKRDFESMARDARVQKRQ
jgi:Domain of unknown function (DUF543)